MNKRKSLDDTCDIFLSRRRVHSPTVQRAASELSLCTPTFCPENIAVPPYFLFPSPLELPELSAIAPIRASTKPLPLPGSSGISQPKPTRLANGLPHVPRPRNPFILFRCDLVHQRRMMPRSDLDDTNISRIAGDLWREMSAAQKSPWIELAAQEKALHSRLYPGYKYAPTHGGSKSRKAKHDVEDRPPRQVSRMGATSPSDQYRSRRHTERPRPYPQPTPRRRPSSCPPAGAVPVPSHTPIEEWAPTLVTQDDIQRRPSRTVMYQSVAPQPVVDPAAPPPAPAEYHPLMPLQGFDWLGLPQTEGSLSEFVYPLPDPNQCPDAYPVPGLACFDNKPAFMPGMSDPGIDLQELTELERLTAGTFTDPFSTLATMPMHDSPYPFPYIWNKC